MKIEILTIFPEIFEGFLQSSLISKAIERGELQISVTNIRDFASPPHFHVDDKPYGGGAGMVFLPEPLSKAIEDAKGRLPEARTILLSPGGSVLKQAKVQNLSVTSELIFVCVRYEGVDQRVVDLLVDEELSLGDFILMGGEVAAMAVIEATTRLIPGVIGNEESVIHESFSPESKNLRIEAPHYTRPAEFRGLKVPGVLLSGNHKKIDEWRLEASMDRTRKMRPDLLIDE